MTSKPHHLHIAALIFFIYRRVRDAIIPIAVFFISINNFLNRFWTVVAIVALAVWLILMTILEYVKFTYELLEDEIVIRSGIFVKKVNHVPYERIQNVTTNQWFFLKPLGLEELKIETASNSDEAEVELKAVPDSLRQKINDLREHRKTSEPDVTSVSLNEEAPQPEAESATNTYQISWADLWKFASTSPAFLSGLLVVLGVYGRLQNVISQRLINNLTERAVHLGVLLLILGIFLVLLIFYVASIAVLINVYYHFKLTETKGQFSTERGWLQNKKTSVAFDRIQAVMIKQPWLRSLLKIVTVQLVVVSNEKDESDKDIIVMPVIKDSKLPEFLKQFFSSTPEITLPDKRPNKLTYYYKLRNATLFAIPLIAINVVVFHAISVLLTIIAIIILVLCYLPAYFSSQRSRIVLLNDDYLLLQNNRLLTKQTFVIPKSSIQLMEKRDSTWLQKRAMASLVVNLRSGTGDKNLRVNYQSSKDVDGALKWYKYE